MALIIINNVTVPTPSEMDVGIMDISKAERNAKGNMIIERITTKRKIGIKYKYLTGAQLSTVLKAVAPTFYNVQYLDPQTNAFVTGSFYCGDRNMGIVSYVNDVIRYEDVSFDLVER